MSVNPQISLLGLLLLCVACKVLTGLVFNIFLDYHIFILLGFEV